MSDDQGSLFQSDDGLKPWQKSQRTEGYPAALYNGSPPSEAVSTSEAAAASVRGVSGRLRTLTYDTIRQSGQTGVTDDELEVLTGLKHQTVSARRRELALLGKIESRGTRLTRSGRKAKVWRAT